jgi:predicted permease
MTMPGAIPSTDRLDQRGNRWLFLLGRLKPRLTASAAQARLAVVASQLQIAFRQNWTDVRGKQRVVTVVPESKARIFPGVRGAVLGFLGLLLAVVGLVLLMACTNVASLLLARAASRRRETAIRLSLGASRGQVVRHLLTESLLLSILAAAVGIVIAGWATDLLMALRPPLPFPVALNLHLDPRVLGFTLATALLTGFLFGLLPALAASRGDLVPALKEGSWTEGRGPGRFSPRKLLVVAQVSMSLVLLTGSGLFLRSLANAHRIDPGFDGQNLLLLSLDVGLNGYDQAKGRSFYGRLLERVQALPGVKAATLATSVPLGLEGRRHRVSIDGYEPQSGEDMEVHTNSVGPGYFEALRIAVLRGRDFGAGDTAGAPGVVAVNEAFARRYWPGQDPIGKHVTEGRSGATPLTVIGVVRDGKYVTLGEDPTPFYYTAFLQRYQGDATLHIRASGDPRSLVATLRREVQALDATLPLFDVKTMSDHLGLSLLPARIAGGALGAFGLVALALAAVGIYGIMAEAVRRRTRELGVRVALGAQPRDVLSLVMGESMRLAAAGMVIGLLVAVSLARMVGGFLYGVSSADPATFVSIPVLLGVAAVVASYLPARWATRVDPVVALRHE